MKTFLFSLAAAAFALTATATEPTIFEGYHNLKLMPSEVSAEGESNLISREDFKTVIYDQYLQKKAEFTFPEQQEFTCTYWREYRDDPNSPWGAGHEYTETLWGDDASEMIVDCNGSAPDYIRATQTFFNNDSKFEFIVPKYELKDFQYEGETSRISGQTLLITAFEIKSQDGATVMTLTIPDQYIKANRYGGNGINSDVSAIIFKDKKYLIATFYDELEEAYLFYDIDGTSGVKAPAMVLEGSMNVHPTLPRRGESVTVDLGAAAQPGCRIAVTAANGRNALNLQAKAGETSVNIPTSSLSSGMYIVTVNNGTSSTEAAKIIIR